MGQLLKILLIICVLIFALSLYFQEKLPENTSILPQVLQSPVQTNTSKREFDAIAGNTRYKINPLYEYELYGLVVSYQHTQHWWDYYHQQWKDYINFKDLCVIWGDNIKSEVYKQMKFNSSSWVCYHRWPNQKVANLFQTNNFSIYHLLTDNFDINHKIMQAKKGDQVYLKGYLVNYSHTNGDFERGTSTSREDTGNNSCESIFVTDFQILKEGNQNWRIANTVSKYTIFGLLLVICIKFFIDFRKYMK